MRRAEVVPYVSASSKKENPKSSAATSSSLSPKLEQPLLNIPCREIRMLPTPSSTSVQHQVVALSSASHGALLELLRSLIHRFCERMRRTHQVFRTRSFKQQRTPVSHKNCPTCFFVDQFASASRNWPAQLPARSAAASGALAIFFPALNCDHASPLFVAPHASRAFFKHCLRRITFSTVEVGPPPPAHKIRSARAAVRFRLLRQSSSSCFTRNTLPHPARQRQIHCRRSAASSFASAESTRSPHATPFRTAMSGLRCRTFESHLV